MVLRLAAATRKQDRIQSHGLEDQCWVSTRTPGLPESLKIRLVYTALFDECQHRLRRLRKLLHFVLKASVTNDLCERCPFGISITPSDLSEKPESGHTFRRSVQNIDCSGRVSSLSQYGECLEGREETANHSVGTTRMVSGSGGTRPKIWRVILSELQEPQ